jgi:hypothetical protein
MDMGAFAKLERLGGPKLEEYRRPVSEADAAQHLSPSHLALANFQKAWEQEVAAEAAAAAARAG